MTASHPAQLDLRQGASSPARLPCGVTGRATTNSTVCGRGDGRNEPSGRGDLDIAIVYGSTYGRTEDAALKIAEELESLLGARPSVFDLGATGPGVMLEHRVLLLGCSTWNGGELQADWDLYLDDLKQLDLTGKLVALFGAGDALAYPETFQDALGILAGACQARGATLIGSWPARGYDFAASKALRGDEFVGLALDYDNEQDLTDGRIAAWCSRLSVALRAAGAARPEPALTSGA